MTFIPFLISFAIGFFFIHLILRKEKEIDLTAHLALAAGSGLALSSHITFFSLIIFDRLNIPWTIGVNLGLLLLLIIAQRYYALKEKKPLFNFTLHRKDLFLLLIFTLACIPAVIEANLYPFGGWDAWSVWNLKARFILLGEEDWKMLFSPVLWRSSPHYPLLLPLVNVWGWSFLKSPAYQTPLLVSIIFSLTTALLLYGALRTYTQNRFSILASLLLLTLPFFVKLAASQYCDIVLSYFLLGSFFCLINARIHRSGAYGWLAGFFLGFLSFTKPEGLAASGLLLMLAIPYFLWKKSLKNAAKKFMGPLFAGLAIAGLPTLLFLKIYAPGNSTFINGFISADHPITWLRLKIIAVFFAVELISQKWNAVWILLLAGIVFSGKKAWDGKFTLIPVFLFFYLCIVIVYYWMNTYFQIIWWLQVTLNRILFTLLPVVVFWIFSSLLPPPQKNP